MYVNVYTFEQDSGWKSRHITCWIVHPSITSSTGPAGSTSISKAPSMVTALVVRLSCEEKWKPLGIEGEQHYPQTISNERTMKYIEVYCQS